MKLTYNEIAEKLGVQPDAVGRKFREVNIGKTFDRYADANGDTIYILESFLDSRSKETRREAKKLLKSYLEGVEIVGHSTSKENKIETPPKKNKLNWLAILPLPLLGLAASFGVFSYACLFCPNYVAFIVASAFEFVYIGLAVQSGLNEKQRKSANMISVSAMLVSVLYNSAAGMFHRRPELLETSGIGFDLFLSLLHGLPIPVLAWAVADLLLHQKRA